MEGESPFYVVPYEKQFGKKQPIVIENAAAATALPSVIEQIASTPTAPTAPAAMLRDAFNKYEEVLVQPANMVYRSAAAGHRLVVLNELNVPTMLRALAEKCDVLYIPSFRIVRRNIAANNTIEPIAELNLFDHPELFSDPAAIRKSMAGLPAEQMNMVIQKLRVYANYVESIGKTLAGSAGDRLECIFSDGRPASEVADKPEMFFQFAIDVNRPIFMSHTNPQLQMLLAMVATPAELSNMFKNNYQFISRIRIHVSKPVRNLTRFNMPAANAMAGGGHGTAEGAHTDDGLNFLYGPMAGGGAAARRKRRATRARATRGRARKTRRANRRRA
jgi:hypothetical protein